MCVPLSATYMYMYRIYAYIQTFMSVYVHMYR